MRQYDDLDTSTRVCSCGAQITWGDIDKLLAWMEIHEQHDKTPTNQITTADGMRCVSEPPECSRNENLRTQALFLGCSPIWYDGIVGPAWHCDCEDSRHAADQQCSVITQGSLDRARAGCK